MKKNNKSKSLIQILVVSLLSISLIVFVFKSDIVRVFSSELEGCTSPLALNYNHLATIDDGSCVISGGVMDILRPDIEEFKNKEWSVNEYEILREKIKMYFKSNNNSDSKQEQVALDNLDLAYMIVLNKESLYAVKNCFRSSKKISKEVLKFYKKYNKENDEIRNARGLFRKKLQITKYKTKVNKLLSNEYNKDDVNNLKDEIKLFKRDRIYKEFEKCNNLKNIIRNAEMNLEDFKQIHDDFRSWNRNRKKYKTSVNPIIIYKFQDYKWYNDTVLAIDTQLREKEIKRMKDKNRRDSIKNLQMRQKSNLELK